MKMKKKCTFNSQQNCKFHCLHCFASCLCKMMQSIQNELWLWVWGNLICSLFCCAFWKKQNGILQKFFILTWHWPATCNGKQSNNSCAQGFLIWFINIDNFQFIHWELIWRFQKSPWFHSQLQNDRIELWIVWNGKISDWKCCKFLCVFSIFAIEHCIEFCHAMCHNAFQSLIPLTCTGNIVFVWKIGTFCSTLHLLIELCTITWQKCICKQKPNVSKHLENFQNSQTSQKLKTELHHG